MHEYIWKKAVNLSPEKRWMQRDRREKSSWEAHRSSACLPALWPSLNVLQFPGPTSGAHIHKPSFNTTQQTRTQFAGNQTFPTISLACFPSSLDFQITLLWSLCHSESFLPPMPYAFPRRLFLSWLLPPHVLFTFFSRTKRMLLPHMSCAEHRHV